MDDTEYSIPSSTKLTLRGLGALFDIVPVVFLFGGWMSSSITAVGAALGAIASLVPLIGWAIGTIINSVGVVIGLPMAWMFILLATGISILGAPTFFLEFKFNDFQSFQQRQFQWLVAGLGVETLMSFLPYWSLMVHFAITTEEARRRRLAKKYNKEMEGRREQRRLESEEEEEENELAYAA